MVDDVGQQVQDWREYSLDALQRTVLLVDVLRQRGNQYVQHAMLGSPPVLNFNYELVLDGNTLPRPVNYQLLRIVPSANDPVHPERRPMVVFDPRAGHGPGIGGFKADSQIGLALANGYPCYFVSFLPEPIPGQTIEDVGRAEAEFLALIARRHPEAEDRPVIIGNCQAGWAVALLSAAAPELMSVVILNGAPLSYWSGERGRNPMRYLGGLTGGTWPAAMVSDLGNGRFDGANLVSNFEFLDPCHSLWTKPYNLYSKIDTEAPRFLEFERWWGGYFLLNKDEMRFITEDLFVGNRLAAGGVPLSTGRSINLREIRAPIVVFASKGDNITPPQQALNWIVDNYQSLDDIRSNNQVIVYMVHENIGHLGIFVSAKIAKREHRAVVDNLDVISTLPPGLFEMVIDEESTGIRFEKRDLDDIRAFDDNRKEEAVFLPVAKVSALTNSFYELFVSPWLRALASEPLAEWQRQCQPTRLRRAVWADSNPWMAPVAGWAEQVRAERQPARPDNLFLQAEHHLSDLIENGLNHFRDVRDLAVETAFYAGYLPLLWALREEIDLALQTHDRVRRERAQKSQLWMEQDLRPRLGEGGLPAAALRILLYFARKRTAHYAQRFRLAERALKHLPAVAQLSPRTLRAILREQSLMLSVDESAAMAALPQMVPDAEDRHIMLDSIESLVEEIGGVDTADMERVKTILGGERRPPSPPPRKGKAEGRSAMH